MMCRKCVSVGYVVPNDQASFRLGKLFPRHALPRKIKAVSQAVPRELAGQVSRDYCGVFWDFDNEYTSGAGLIRKLGIVQGVAGKHSCSIHTFNIYVNPATRKAISRQSCKAIERAGARLIPVNSRREAGDLAITSDAYHFCQRHREKACVILLSADSGFAGLLSYVRSLGCLTIVIGRFSVTPRVKANPGMSRKLPCHLQQILRLNGRIWIDVDKILDSRGVWAP